MFFRSYYHGAYSRIVVPGVQYIHEDVVWKETGFISCGDTIYTSIVYFSMMGCLALFSIISLFGCGLAFSFSVCAKSVSISRATCANQRFTQVCLYIMLYYIMWYYVMLYNVMLYHVVI